MFGRLINRYLLVLLSLFLIACSDMRKQDALSANEANAETQQINQVYQASLFNKAGDKLLSISNVEQIKKIEEILASSKVTMVKLLPLFERKLVIQTAEGQSEWWVSSRYIKSATQENAPLMKLESDINLLDYIKNSIE